jgi:hypothetical protein
MISTAKIKSPYSIFLENSSFFKIILQINTFNKKKLMYKVFKKNMFFNFFLFRKLNIIFNDYILFFLGFFLYFQLHGKH